MDVQARHSGEHRGTVEQRQAVFGLELELDWGNASLLQRFLRGHTLALIECFRLRNANEDGDNVSHGSEVAAGADAALPRHHRMNALVQQLDQTLNHDWTQTGHTAAEGIQTNTHGRTDDLLGSWVADTAAMGQDRAILVQVALLDGNLVIFVLTKTRVEAIHSGRVIAHPLAFHIVADLSNVRHALLVNFDLIPLTGNIHDVFNFEIHAIENYFVHLLFLLFRY